LRDGYIYKYYQEDTLLDTPETIKKRVSLINNFEYKKYKALVKTTITKKSDSYTYKQNFFKIKKIETLKKEDFFYLVEALEYLHAIGFVHADLNRKNIIYTQEGFKIIDYEPSLLQMKNGIRQLMITMPYVSKEELKNEDITNKTDKLGFYYFLLRVHNLFSSKDIVKISKKLDHCQIIKRDIESLNYSEILAYACKIL